MEDKSVISLQVPEAVNAFLSEESERRMTSKSAVVREILATHLKSLGVNYRQVPVPVPAPAANQAKVEPVTP